MSPYLLQKRSVEDLKERYYCICGKLMKVRAASGAEPKIYIFDAGHERRRKEQLDKLFNRTPEQVSERAVPSKSIIVWIALSDELSDTFLESKSIILFNH